MSLEASATNNDRWFRALIEHSSEVIALLTPEGTVLYTSPSIERVLGYTPQECMAKSACAVIHPDDSVSLGHTFQHLLAIPGLVNTHQFRCRHKDGTWRWVEATMTNLLQDPDVQALVTNVRDISERKQAEEKELMALAQRKKERLVESAERKYIEESEQRFRLLADRAPVMIWTSGIDKLCTYFNAPWLAFTGRTMEQELGNGWADGVYPADKQRCLDIYTSSFDARKPFSMEYRLRRFDGQYRWILDNGIPFYAPDGTFTGYIGSCIDITERRTLEQQLQYSELKLRSLVEANILGVIVADLDGRIYESNDCFARILGYSTDELLAETFSWGQLIPLESHEALRRLITPFLSTAAMPPFEWEYLHKDGGRVPMLAMATPLDQERRLALMVTLDISDRKAAERRKQQFLRMVSHELRTPLTAILGLIELALRDIKRRPTSLEPEAEGLLGQIEQKLKLACGQVNIETRLVGDLLEVSQLEMHQFTLSLHQENLVTIVQETIVSHQAARSRDIKLVLPPAEVVSVIADADRIGQVLTNYLTNAFKLAPADQLIAVQLEVEAGSVRVSVQDRGQGLTQEQQQRVWEQFYQVATPVHQGTSRGLGLGLAIAKAIIEQHHGQVGVESTPGQGATFWFTLPLADGPIQT
jgi:PAS domain S-box-containing protein